ncbi:MAG: hypothetical protein U0350_38300 [Caldilineaceae bacterium]
MTKKKQSNRALQLDGKRHGAGEWLCPKCGKWHKKDTVMRVDGVFTAKGKKIHS